MSSRTLNLLHVEDNPAYRRLVSHYLTGQPGLVFDVVHAESEEVAVAVFRGGGLDLVLLDYHLAEGNGLSCLRRLRELDPLAPIVALSGKATPEIAMELLDVGADDFLSKEDLNRDMLLRSLKAALDRAALCRQRAATASAAGASPATAMFEQLCADFVQRGGPELSDALDRFEAVARQERLSADQAYLMFDAACRRLEADRSSNRSASLRRLLRPLILEVAARLFDRTSAKS